jgi:hypothetical protein
MNTSEQTTPIVSLLSAIASILNAIAWPTVVGWFLFSNKKRIALLLKVLIRKLATAKKFKLGQLEIDQLEEEIEDAVDTAGQHADAPDLPRTIPSDQIEAAKALKEKIETTSISSANIRNTVRREIHKLAQEYDSIREQMESGPARTRRMNEIAAGMRTLALAALPLRTELTRSSSAGQRLAAICILQVEPRQRYFRWLIERVKTEQHPFLLYHAALAIVEAVKKGFYINPDEARNLIKEAILSVSSYRGGSPDQNTLDALNEALSLV